MIQKIVGGLCGVGLYILVYVMPWFFEQADFAFHVSFEWHLVLALLLIPFYFRWGSPFARAFFWGYLVFYSLHPVMKTIFWFIPPTFVDGAEIRFTLFLYFPLLLLLGILKSSDRLSRWGQQVALVSGILFSFHALYMLSSVPTWTTLSHYAAQDSMRTSPEPIDIVHRHPAFQVVQDTVADKPYHRESWTTIRNTIVFQPYCWALRVVEEPSFYLGELSLGGLDEFITQYNLYHYSELYDSTGTLLTRW